MDTRNAERETGPEAGASGRSLWWSAAVGFVLLTALTGAALFTINRALDGSREARDAVALNRTILEEVQRVFSTLQDAETGQRGFLITGNDVFLEPYNVAREGLDAQLRQLDVLVSDRDARSLLAELSVTAQQQMAFYDNVVALRRQSGFAAAADQVSQQFGKRRMDAIRTLIADIRAREEQLLGERLQADFDSSTRAERLIQSLVVAAMLIVLLVGARMLFDVHRRGKVERSLTMANALLNSTLNSVTQGIAVFDAKQRLVAWNPRYAELRRLEPGFLNAGTTLAETLARGHMFHVRDLETNTERSMPSAGRDIAGFHMQPLLLELRADDGQILEARGQPSADGYYVFTYTDITALKRSEHAYRDRATRLTSTLDAVVDAIITINESGSIESWSKGAERMFGYPAEEVIRRNVSLIMPEIHAGAHDGYLRRFLTTGEQRVMGRRREMEARHRDGHTFPVDLGISEMRLDERRLFIGVIRDITERREIERLKNEFVSTVSHELRTPLTSISGALGLLAGNIGGAVPAGARRLVDIAQQNSERLVRLINDILDMEKAGAGKLEFHLEPQLLKPIVQAALEANRGLAEGRGVTLELDPQSADDTVNTDRDRLIQVLTNLLSNAIKFSPPGGVVRVRIDREAGLLKVAVRDDGPGIPSAFRARIFQKFAQADSSDSRRRGGTGLGLSIAQAITERLGGTIGFESSEGAGSTFHASFPVWQPVALDVREVPAAPPGRRVLVCEDDPDIARVLVGLLDGAGLDPVVAMTAAEARQQLRRYPFDLVLVDLNLPDADGLELIASLRSDPQAVAVPVIVMTARHQSGNAELLHSLQLADWLTKPVDPARLLNSIHLAIREGHAGRCRILHVEDDASLVEMVQTMLAPEATVTIAPTLAEARRRLEEADFDLVILDLSLADGSGLELLPQLKGRHPPVVLYSASEASREVAAEVEAALVKSRDSLEQLLVTVRRLAPRKAGPVIPA